MLRDVRTGLVLLVLSSVQCVQQSTDGARNPHIHYCNDQYLLKLTRHMTVNLNEQRAGDRIELLQVPKYAYSTCLFAIDHQVPLSVAKIYCSKAHLNGTFPVASVKLLKCLLNTNLNKHLHAPFFVYTIMDNDKLAKLTANDGYACDPAPARVLKGMSEDPNTGYPLKLLSMQTDKDESASDTWKIGPYYDRKEARVMCELPGPPTMTTATSTSTDSMTTAINVTSSDSSPTSTSPTTAAQQPTTSTTAATSAAPVSDSTATSSTPQHTTSRNTGPEIVEEKPELSTVDPDLINIYLLLGFLGLLFVLLIVLALLVVSRRRRRKKGRKGDGAVRKREKRRQEKNKVKKRPTASDSPDASTRSLSPTESITSPPSLLSKPPIVPVPAAKSKKKALKVTEPGSGSSSMESPKSQYNTPPTPPPPLRRAQTRDKQGGSSDSSEEYSFSRAPRADPLVKSISRPQQNKNSGPEQHQTKTEHAPPQPTKIEQPAPLPKDSKI